jgi:hypothetical protein
MKTRKKALYGPRNGKRYLPAFLILERKLNAIEGVYGEITGLSGNIREAVAPVLEEA